MSGPFETMKADFDMEINGLWERGLDPATKHRIITCADRFATEITQKTGIDHGAFVQFSEVHGLVQITIKSRHDDVFCFIRKGAEDESIEDL